MVDSKDLAGKQAIEASDFTAPGAGPDLLSSSDKTAKSSIGAGPVNGSATLLQTRADAPWWHSQFNLMLCVFGLLGVAALLFVLLTPAPTATNISTVVSAQGETSVGQSAVSDTDDTAPWDESRRKQARTDSQDILADLLDAKKDLETKSVDEWGAEGFEAALALAADGDEFYKRKDFVNAVKTYQAALEKMQSLDTLIPSVLKGLVKQGSAAIEQGKTELAREKFQQALRLDQNHIPALSGIDRTNTLNQVLELLRAAALDEQEFANTDELDNLDLAAQKYQQAIALDARTDAANEGASRVEELIADKKYRDAMTSGLNALFANRYNAAKSGFSQALKIRPNDATANTAYRQSLASDKRSSLSSLISSAKAQEKKRRVG